MELLHPTLQDLEKAGRTVGSLDQHYVGKIYPQFKDELRNTGIPDIDNYEGYNLQNLLDDLTHIQTLLKGSPKKQNFHQKLNFLVQLSRGTLKRVAEGPHATRTQVVKVQKDKLVAQPVAVENKKDDKTKTAKIVHKEVKVTQKEKELTKKKTAPFGVLAKISEEVAWEDASEIDFPKMRAQAVASEPTWTLTQEQQQMVQNTLKKYEMPEDIWRNYILTKVHGDAQLRRMGIEIPVAKVDCEIETLKFVEEVERHMVRKAKAQAKKQRVASAGLVTTAGLSPMLADQICNSSDLKGSSLFDITPVNRLSVRELTKTWSQTHSSIELDSTPQNQGATAKKTFITMITSSMRLNESNDKPINAASEAAVQQPVEKPLPLHSSSSSQERRKKISKTWGLTSLTSTTSIINQTMPIDSLENANLHDSLHESLNGDHIPMYQYNKSRGQYRLPSISSSSSRRASHSHLAESTVLSTSGKYKRAQEQVSREGCSIVDSLEGDSLTANPRRHDDSKKVFRISNIGTIRSKYISSYNSGSKTASNIDARGSLNPRDMNRNYQKSLTQRSQTEPCEAEVLRSDLDSEDAGRSESSGSINDRSTIKTTSTKTLVTVYSQNASMQFSRQVSRKTSQIMKSLDECESEYCGEVKRLYLLGSGSEAKVFLCRMKGFETEVALKQYDLVKSNKKNGEAFEGLKKEFEMLRQVKHDNIIKYLSLYKPQTTTYNNCLEFGIIMEHMPGGSLDSFIEEDFTSLSFSFKKKIMKQILSGLEFLHQHNIIHRDLKPGNILLSEDKNSIKISDFGISKKTNNDTNTKRTLVGTPWYMAPEVINQEGYSSKADIWSAGCCFYHLVTGEKPYHNANAIQALLLMVNHKSPLEVCPPEILAQINEHAHVKDFLNLCFSRDNAERPSAMSLMEHPLFQEE